MGAGVLTSGYFSTMCPDIMGQAPWLNLLPRGGEAKSDEGADALAQEALLCGQERDNHLPRMVSHLGLQVYLLPPLKKSRCCFGRKQLRVALKSWCLRTGAVVGGVGGVSGSWIQGYTCICMGTLRQLRSRRPEHSDLSHLPMSSSIAGSSSASHLTPERLRCLTCKTGTKARNYRLALRMRKQWRCSHFLNHETLNKVLLFLLLPLHQVKALKWSHV